MKQKSGLTLVELSIGVLIISCISIVLIIVLRSNLNTMSFGQKHMNFNQKIALATRKMFYDLKGINPILVKSLNYGYALSGESKGTALPRIVTVNEYHDKTYSVEFSYNEEPGDELPFRVRYYFKDNKIFRYERNPSGKEKTEVVLENVKEFVVGTDETDIKQIYVSFVASDPTNGVKPEKIDFAVRLETDFVCVKKFEEVAND